MRLGHDEKNAMSGRNAQLASLVLGATTHTQLYAVWTLLFTVTSVTWQQEIFATLLEDASKTLHLVA
jgi:hypothetical protein